MRLTGAVLLTAAGLLAGVTARAAMDARVRRMTELLELLELLDLELGRFRTPMPALFAALSERARGAGAALCRRVGSGLETLGEQPFSDIWAGALADLPTPERDILIPLGTVLGRYGAEEQLMVLERCRRELEQARDEAAAALREKGRMAVGLGAAGGAALAVLLI